MHGQDARADRTSPVTGLESAFDPSEERASAPADVVRAWCAAYVAGSVEAMIGLADEAIVGTVGGTLRAARPGRGARGARRQIRPISCSSSGSDT